MSAWWAIRASAYRNYALQALLERRVGVEPAGERQGAQPRAEAARRQGVHLGGAEGEVATEFEQLLCRGEAGHHYEERGEQGFQTSLLLFA